MMRGMIIVVEGDTEEAFVKQTLLPYLNQYHVYDVKPIKATTSKGYKGGIVNYQKFRNDIIRYLRQERDMLVSSLIDFFRIPPSFPNFDETKAISLASEKVSKLEEGMSADINDPRFIPYIQLHEFEALLFTSDKGFAALFNNDTHIISEVNRILTKYENPEDINDNPNTAPSNRLKSIIPGYDKVVYGNLIIEEHGIEQILQKCPRFNQWVSTLINRMKESHDPNF